MSRENTKNGMQIPILYVLGKIEINGNFIFISTISHKHNFNVSMWSAHNKHDEALISLLSHLSIVMASKKIR